LSPNTQRARKKVVSNLAEKVYKVQLLESPNADGQKDRFRSKYGSVKSIVADTKKLYPWVDRQKKYNSLFTFKNRKTRAMLKNGMSSQVLQEQFVLGSWKAPGDRPEGSTAKAKQSLDVKKKRAIDEVAISYSKENVKFQAKVPDGSFEKICHKVHDDFKIPWDSLNIKKETILLLLLGNPFMSKREVVCDLQWKRLNLLSLSLPSGNKKLANPSPQEKALHSQLP
jgi:hypothetical protein